MSQSFVPSAGRSVDGTRACDSRACREHSLGPRLPQLARTLTQGAMSWLDAIQSTVSTALLSAGAVVGLRFWEQPPYAVLAQIGDSVEVRGYGSRLAAEAAVEAADPEAGRNAAFELLFRYITGANRSRAKIAMTAPVATAPGAEQIAMTTPVAAAVDEGRYTMRFFLPASYTADSAPDPVDERLRVVVVPAETVAALRFSGSSGDRELEHRAAELLRTLESSPWRPTAAPTTLFYDPPFTIPFLRRTEVVVAVAPAAR